MKRGIKASALVIGLIGTVIIYFIYVCRSLYLSFLAFNPYVFIIGVTIISIGLIYLLSWLLITKAMKMSMSDFGMGKVRISAKWIIIAFALPLAVVGIFLLMPGDFDVAPFVASGYAKYFGEGIANAPFVIIANILYVGCVAGICEEIIFRGLIMHLVGRKWGVIAGILVPSLIFPAVHIAMMGHVTVEGVVMLFIGGGAVGAMFCMVALANGDNIWSSALIHGLWDALVIGIFSIYSTAPGQGVAHLFSKHLDSTSLLLTGGDFGIEVSLICIAGYLVVFAIAYMQYRKNKELQPQE